MSSGGGFAPSQNSSNVTTNVAPTTSQTAPAPSGGKGGYNNSPMTMEDFAQQRPQVYMPPAQPTFYDQAFNSSYYNPGFQRPRMDYGLGSMGNAYVRRMPMYSPQTPIEASPPPSEMNYAPGGYDLPPQELMSDSWRRRPRLEPTAPVEATRGVISEPNYSGGLGSLMSNSSNPAYMQQAAFNYGNSEEARRNSIQRQLNDAFTASQKAGKSILESAREQDEISARLHAQYGLKPYAMSSG